MKKNIFFAILCTISIYSFAQITIDDWSSDLIKLKDSKENLYKTLGKPDTIVNSKILIFDTLHKVDISYSFRCFVYKTLDVVYYSKDDSVFLSSIMFRKDTIDSFTNIKLKNNYLNRNYYVDLFVKDYPILEADIEEYRFAGIDYITGDIIDDAYIFVMHGLGSFNSVEFCFDISQKLKYVHFSYNFYFPLIY